MANILVNVEKGIEIAATDAPLQQLIETFLKKKFQIACLDQIRALESENPDIEVLGPPFLSDLFVKMSNLPPVEFRNYVNDFEPLTDDEEFVIYDQTKSVELWITENLSSA